MRQLGLPRRLILPLARLAVIDGARKGSSATWSTFSPFTSRVADASGNALFYIRMASPSWWSFRAQVGSIYSNAVQSRWMS